jgi:hypothetical protein
VYPIAAFLGAALLFLIEPMATKALLPRLGGSAAVWSVSLVFFQVVLLAGYAYAHLLSRLRRGALVHAVVVALAALALPWRGLAPPAWPLAPPLFVLAALASWVGAPFFTLAATGPLLQRWLPGEPYRLYAVGNAGSLLALLLYPLVVERYLSLGAQALVWSSAFLLLVALTWACAARARAHPVEAAVAVPWRRRLSWLALAAIPSAAMLATTQALTTDVASVPLLWIAPLVVYLGTFIVAFGMARPPVRWAAMAVAGLVPSVTACQWLIAQPDPHVALPLYLFTLGAIALLCHGRLVQLRPATGGPTEFYLFVAGGGALGAVFCGLVAPLLFRSVVEYPIVLVLACLAIPAARGVPIGLAPALAAVLLAALAAPGAGHRLFTARSFFGVLRVEDAAGPVFKPSTGPHAGREMRLPLHELFHGTTLHGAQVARPAEARLPTSYYHPSGPIGRVFEGLPHREVGVVGLGVGSLAAYAHPGERFTFFEIDPAVVRIARDPRLFTYLADARGTIDVVVADGRVALGALPDGRLDLLVIDAFGSDAVPVHLLTIEALALDLRKVSPAGLVAFHVSSRFFDLAPVLAEAAARLGKEGAFCRDTDLGTVEAITGKRPSDWVIVAADPAVVHAAMGLGAWVPLATQRRTTGGAWLWTDRYSSPLASLRPWNFGFRR